MLHLMYLFTYLLLYEIIAFPIKRPVEWRFSRSDPDQLLDQSVGLFYLLVVCFN
jgi:hypothetical protein